MSRMKWTMDRELATRIAIAVFVCVAAWALPTPPGKLRGCARVVRLATAPETPDEEGATVHAVSGSVV